jgi:hypothetical protein
MRWQIGNGMDVGGKMGVNVRVGDRVRRSR